MSDDEYMLLPTEPAAIAAFMSGLASNGVAVEEAVVELPSENSSGTLSIQFENADQEGQR